MSTKTKGIGIWELFRTMFSSEPDIEEYDEKELSPEQKQAWKDIEFREEIVISSITSSSKSGGKKEFVKPIINSKIDAAMRKKIESFKSKDREIGD